MAEAVRVIVASGDRPQVVDTRRAGSVVGADIRAGNLECREFALRAAQEPMEYTVPVLVGPHYRSPTIDPAGVCPVVVSRLGVRTGSLEIDDVGLLGRSR